MNAPTFTRRPGAFCDLCNAPSFHVACASYEVEFSHMTLSTTTTAEGEVLVCAVCAATLVRVALGHEVQS